MCIAERVELERRVALRNNLRRLFGKTLRRTLTRIPAVRIHPDALSQLFAQQPVHRHAKRLTQNVPARHLDTRHGRSDPDERRQVKLVKDLVDVSGVHPDHEVLDLFDRGNPWLCLGTSSGFTDANHPLVGLDHYESPVLPRISDNDSSDISDLHLATPTYS